MSKKPVSLPNIEDVTFLAYLDPLAEALGPAPGYDPGLGMEDLPWPELAPNRLPSGPGWAPSQEPPAMPIRGERPRASAACSATPPSLAAWRSQADEEFADLRAVAVFLAKTDAELATMVQAHPRQVLGFMERISRIQQRRAAQSENLAALMTRVHGVMLRAATDAGQRHGEADRRPIRSLA